MAAHFSFFKMYPIFILTNSHSKASFPIDTDKLFYLIHNPLSAILQLTQPQLQLSGLLPRLQSILILLNFRIQLILIIPINIIILPPYDRIPEPS